MDNTEYEKPLQFLEEYFSLCLKHNMCIASDGEAIQVWNKGPVVPANYSNWQYNDAFVEKAEALLEKIKNNQDA